MPSGCPALFLCTAVDAPGASWCCWAPSYTLWGRLWHRSMGICASRPVFVLQRGASSGSAAHHILAACCFVGLFQGYWWLVCLCVYMLGLQVCVCQDLGRKLPSCLPFQVPGHMQVLLLSTQLACHASHIGIVIMLTTRAGQRLDAANTCCCQHQG
jgi:hypothetical protein